MSSPDPLPPHPELPRYYREPHERPSYVRDMFDTTAPWYDISTRILALGSGDWYRSRALLRAGLQPGMDLLDLATGTGAVAAAARDAAGGLTIVGADVSIGMICEAKRKKILMPVQTAGERLPFPEQTFDMVSVGFALRHFSDLRATFGEIRRVLRPRGRVLILEITSPEGWLGRKLLEIYMKRLVPAAARLRSRDRHVQEMLQYYWDTIEGCVPPPTILAALREAGFAEVARHVEVFVNSEYTGTAG